MNAPADAIHLVNAYNIFIGESNTTDCKYYKGRFFKNIGKAFRLVFQCQHFIDFVK